MGKFGDQKRRSSKRERDTEANNHIPTNKTTNSLTGALLNYTKNHNKVVNDKRQTAI